MHLIILIAGSLLCIVSLFTACNALVGWLFDTIQVFDWTSPVKKSVTIELLASYLFTPVALVIGIPWNDARLAGSLMAMKMMENEFVAYAALKLFQDESKVSARTLDLMAFALCGFANFSSIGTLLNYWIL
jgi:CNT family concentrative nucleoside transporter